MMSSMTGAVLGFLEDGMSFHTSSLVTKHQWLLKKKIKKISHLTSLTTNPNRLAINIQRAAFFKFSRCCSVAAAAAERIKPLAWKTYISVPTAISDGLPPGKEGEARGACTRIS